jgi:DNA-binding CsgD family transcriptional regulator
VSFKYSLSSPLSKKQTIVWSLLRDGFSVSMIAIKLKTTRQNINQTRLTAEAKLSTTLREVAEANELQIIKLYPKKAILLGYHPGLKRKAIITYTTSHGIKVWYWHENPQEITDENFLNQIHKYVLDIAQEQGIELHTKEKNSVKLAQILFNKLLPEVNP